jgi:hypothetical protein
MSSSETYEEYYKKAESEGIFTKDGILELMINSGLWGLNEEDELQKTPKTIDKLKVQLYENYSAFKSKQVERIRRQLKKYRKRYLQLLEKKNKYDTYTCEGIAFIYQLHSILSSHTFDEFGQTIDTLSLSHEEASQLIGFYNSSFLSEESIRKLARNSEWRMIWSAGKHEGSTFGISSCQLTEEQISIITWSKLYDNISEHPEPPDEHVINDDDMLDGWLITQDNKRKSERSKKQGNDGGGPGRRETFIPAETPHDASRINNMNDLGGKIVKQQRANMLQKRGAIRDEELPDSQQELRTIATQQNRQAMQSNRRK